MKKTFSLLLALMLVLALVPAAALAAGAEIPDDAVSFNGHFYKRYESSKTWQDAQAYCESMGGHLVTITSQEEQAFLEDYLADAGGKYMIGLHRSIDDLGTWVTGEALVYTNWGTNEPDNLNGNQPVGVLVPRGTSGSGYSIAPFQWDDDNNSSYYFICEWDQPRTSFGSEVSPWATPEMEKAYEMDLIPDILIGEDLTQRINRAEFAAVAVKTYEALTGVKAIPAVVNPFSDCGDVEVLKAYNVGVINGTSATTFSPSLWLDREQAATLLTRVFKRVTMPGWALDADSQYPLLYTAPAPFADDGDISSWAREGVYFMAANKIITGMPGNRFAPKNVTSAQEAEGYANATREQTLAIAVRMVEKLG